MNTPLLGWLADPSPTRGVHLAVDGGGWTVHPYREIAGAASRVVAVLRAAGIRRGDVVSLVLTDTPVFIAHFYGVIAAGGIVNPLPPPTVFLSTDDYSGHLAHLIRSAASRFVATEPFFAEALHRAAELAGTGTVLADLTADPTGTDAAADPVAEPAAADTVLVQFTSGSSGRPRPVAVRAGELRANIDVIHRWLGWSAQTRGATWLPTYHDMGLIGTTLCPVAAQSDIMSLRPDQFIREPVRWLECFGRYGTELTAAPNFGYGYAAKRVRPEALAGMDFSGWKGAVCGAERVSRRALESFAALLAPYGFRPDGFRPAYGLAEVTLAAAGVPLGQPATAVRVDWDTARFGEPVKIIDEDTVGAAPGEDDWVVGCGPALHDLTVAVVGDAGDRLPDGYLGEIELTGTSVAGGSLPAAPDGVANATDGVLRTGDHGFLHGGQLYVLGRAGDSVKVRGRAVYAEDLEARLVVDAGLSAGRLVVLPGAVRGVPTVVALVCRPDGPWVAEAGRILVRAVGADVRVWVLAAPPQALLRTTSGKPRRRAMFQAFQDGALGGAVVFDSRGPVERE